MLDLRSGSTSGLSNSPNHSTQVLEDYFETFIDDIFAERDSIPDTDFLVILRADTQVWIDDETILDLLEDDMSKETVEFLCQEPNVVEIDEDPLVRALADAYNENARRDLVFLRNRIFEAS